MSHSAPVDGLSLADADAGTSARHDPGSAVVLLEGWPGDSHDYRHDAPLLEDELRVVVPDPRGFGDSDRHLLDRTPSTAHQRKPAAWHI